MTDRAKYNYDAFISYNHKDKEWVRGYLLSELEKAGLKVWIDFRDSPIGESLITSMEQAIHQCWKTIIVLTPDWVESEYAQFEGFLSGGRDLTGRHKRILPLMLKQCKTPPYLRMRVHADFTDKTLWEHSMTRVLSAFDSESARRAFKVVSSLRNSPEVQNAIKKFRDEFRECCELIKILNGYKNLHDRFHDLQRALLLINHERKRLPDDPAAWERVMLNEPELQSSIEYLLNIVKHSPFADAESNWANQLNLAKAELHVALESSDVDQLKKSTNRLNRVLTRVPSRINTRIHDGAESLRLSQLIRALQEIRSSFNGELEKDSAQKLDKGVEALKRLSDSLSGLVGSHNSWQELDDELHRVEELLEQDVDELVLAWPDLKLLLQKLCSEEPLETRQSIDLLCAQLETALSTNDSRLKWKFHSLRRALFQRFNEVDHKLLDLCEGMQQIGEPLTELLEEK